MSEERHVAVILSPSLIQHHVLHIIIKMIYWFPGAGWGGVGVSGDPHCLQWYKRNPDPYKINICQRPTSGGKRDTKVMGGRDRIMEG